LNSIEFTARLDSGKETRRGQSSAAVSDIIGRGSDNLAIGNEPLGRVVEVWRILKSRDMVATRVGMP